MESVAIAYLSKASRYTAIWSVKLHNLVKVPTLIGRRYNNDVLVYEE